MATNLVVHIYSFIVLEVGSTKQKVFLKIYLFILGRKHEMGRGRRREIVLGRLCTELRAQNGEPKARVGWLIGYHRGTSKMSLEGQISRCLAGLVPSRDSKTESMPCLFQPWEDYGNILHLQDITLPLLLWWHLFSPLWPSSPPLVRTFLITVGPTG